MRKRSLLGLMAACFLALLAVPAWAQGEMHKTVYTYVSEWAVPRPMWPEMAKVDAADHAMLDKFLADGTITSYGDFVNLVHQEGTPTHGGWFQSNSIGGILKVLAAYAAQPGPAPPVLSASKHWDYFLEADGDDVGIHPGTYTNAYMRGVEIQLKPGQEEHFGKLFKTYIEPVYRQLMSEGTLIYFGVDGQYVVSSPGTTVDVVVIAANADAVDKAAAAVEAVFAKDPAVGPALMGTTKHGSFRSFISAIPFAKFK
jgi:hypothetical protein